MVWTPLYGLIAWGSARAIDNARGKERAALGRAVGVNLVLNAGWPGVFFGARRPRGALAEIVALNLSNADLVRRAWRVDQGAALALVPYAAWTGFATALNASIVLRNPQLAGHGVRTGSGRCQAGSPS
ncbi:hypothetical protein GCM10010468_51720 [Actinocorallia longicatena]|uniref:TspO/MBR related protein n=1 Tax=Actinocorallia longicatena TaxID=111803 RepID=A0ABP6QFM9_9ACTN